MTKLTKTQAVAQMTMARERVVVLEAEVEKQREQIASMSEDVQRLRDAELAMDEVERAGGDAPHRALSLATRIRVTRASQRGRCVRCGRNVEPARLCYAIPHCYACLPPPPPLPTCGRVGAIEGAVFIIIDGRRWYSETFVDSTCDRSDRAEAKLARCVEAGAELLSLSSAGPRTMETAWAKLRAAIERENMLARIWRDRFGQTLG